MDLGSLLSALALGLVAGVVARALVPNDAFQSMSGPKSWLVSIGLGLAGALLGYWLFSLIGIGDEDKFDWGGVIGAVIGAIIVVIGASAVVKRMAKRP